VRASQRQSEYPAGFTLVEVLVVVILLGIIGAAVVPMFFGVGGMQGMSAARIISSDLQYAQNVAITSQQPVSVTFDTSGNSYSLTNASGPLKHPMTHADYLVDLRTQNGFDQLDIATASFQGSPSVTFDELGSPSDGGSVTVRGGEEVYRIDVSPVTGTVAVTRVGP